MYFLVIRIVITLERARSHVYFKQINIVQTYLFTIVYLIALPRNTNRFEIIPSLLLESPLMMK